jgi:cytochrome c biogenesis protein
MVAVKAFLSFFSSLKLAIVLIIAITVASVVGTLIPQGGSAAAYAARYGALAGPLVRLQFTRLYSSPWFLALLFLFAVNTIVCTLVRLGPKLRRAFRPNVAADPAELLALKVSGRIHRPGDPASAAAAATRLLAAGRYRVRRVDGEGRFSLLARKRVAGLFGSDVVHLGLLIVLAGGLLSGFGAFRTELTFREGRAVEVPGAGFSLRLEKFVTEYYPQGGVKDWKSTLTILEAGRSLGGRVVEVNHPLVHRGFSFYQSGYGRDWEEPEIEIAVRKASDPAFAGTLRPRLGEETPLGDAAGTRIIVRRFVPDLVVGEDGTVGSRSSEPRNPAVLVEARRGAEKIYESWVFAGRPDFAAGHGGQEAELVVELTGFDAPPLSVIEVARDPGAAFIWIGCVVVMLGFGLAFYWPPREIRVVAASAGGRTDIAAGGVAAKGRDAFAAEFRAFLDALRRSP